MNLHPDAANVDVEMNELTLAERSVELVRTWIDPRRRATPRTDPAVQRRGRGQAHDRAALAALARDGVVGPATVAKAITRYEIDTEGLPPWLR